MTDEFDDIPFFSEDQAVYQERDELKETVDHLEHELKRLRPKSKKDQLPPLPDFSEINREWLLAVRGAAVARLGDAYIRIPIESSILYLHNWHVQEILENVDEEMYVISAAYEDDAISCPECGSRSFVKFGTKVQHYHDTPIRAAQADQDWINACAKSVPDMLADLDLLVALVSQMLYGIDDYWACRNLHIIEQAEKIAQRKYDNTCED